MLFGRLGLSFGKLGRGGRGGASGPRIILSGSLTVSDTASVGDDVGTAAISGATTGTASWSLSSNPGGKFTINSSTGLVEVAGALTAGSYLITIAVSGTTPDPADRVFTITAGDTTAPTITSASTANNVENVVLAHALTASETVTWSIVGGADQARFEISGSTLRWLSNGTKNYEAPDDADTNNTYVVTVRATDTALNTADQTITITVTDTASEGPPVNTVAPAVTGTETEGETLTSTSGTWTGAATITYAYQWYQAVLDGGNNVVTDMSGVPLLDNPISAATASTYVLQAGDVGAKIFCYVTATNGVGSASKASNATGLIAAAVSYAGPGDIVSGAIAWWGLRAYSVAAIGSSVVDIKRASDNTTQTFISLADGSLDVASITTFLAATTGTITKLYDQSGNGLHQLTASNDPAFTLSAIGSLPGITFNGSKYLDTGAVAPAQAQPFTISAAYKRTGNFSAYQAVIGINVGLVLLGSTNSTDVVGMYAGGGASVAATDNTFHAVEAVLNGASSVLYVDGAGSTVDPGTIGISAGTRVLLGSDPGNLFTGVYLEGGIWGSGFDATQRANMNLNKTAYWGI